MKLITLAVTSFAFLLSALAQERKTVYVDRMEGLESFVEKALQDAELRAKLAKLGVDPMPMSSDEFQKRVGGEIAMNAALVKAVGIAPQQH